MALSYEQWLVAFAVASVLAKLAVVYLAVKHRDDPSDDASATDDPPTSEPAPRRAVCSRCGTDNDPAYYFCRNCVTDLPSDPVLA